MATYRFPALKPERMRERAHSHAAEYGASLSHRSVSDDERAVVNWLRHQHSDYDEEPTAENHRAVCEAIGRQFPWLAEECARQVARRQERDEKAENLRDRLEAQKEHEREERRALVSASREAAARLHSGQRVQITRKGRKYQGVVEKVGRSKVTVAYQIKTGPQRDRTLSLYAALVDPLD